jgi:hypothetical protein
MNFARSHKIYVYFLVDRELRFKTWSYEWFLFGIINTKQIKIPQL